MKIIAHRGISIYRVPENTFTAFLKAVKEGFAIETDVQMTQDRQLVLYHDDLIPGPADQNLNGGGFYHLVGSRAIADCTLEELRSQIRFDKNKLEAMLCQQAGKLISLELDEEPTIATFQELIKLIQQFPEAQVYLEIKRKEDDAEYSDGMENEILRLIREANLLDNFTIISFNKHSLIAIRKLHPDIRIGIDVKSISSARKLKESIGISSWHPAINLVDQKLVAKIHKLGLSIIPWTNTEDLTTEQATIKRIKSYGIDGVITNQAKEISKLQ